MENRAGAGGNLGADAVAKAPPDGYTILQTTNGQAISPSLYRNLPFDALRDFVPVTQLVASSSDRWLVGRSSRRRSAKELIALAKAKPGKLNYGSTGVGNPLHLTMEMFKHAAGIDILAVPYRGDAPINAALIAGEVEVGGGADGDRAAAHAGRPLRALAVDRRAARAGAAGRADCRRRARARLRVTSWQGLFVPANTPREIVRAIQRETAKAAQGT